MNKISLTNAYTIRIYFNDNLYDSVYDMKGFSFFNTVENMLK